MGSNSICRQIKLFTHMYIAYLRLTNINDLVELELPPNDAALVHPYNGLCVHFQS